MVVGVGTHDHDARLVAVLARGHRRVYSDHDAHQVRHTLVVNARRVNHLPLPQGAFDVLQVLSV